MGSKTAILRHEVLFRSSLIKNSNKLYSNKLSRLEIPVLSQKLRIEEGVNPLRRKPLMVGILGSSQLFTYFSVTNCNNLRLLVTV